MQYSNQTHADGVTLRLHGDSPQQSSWFVLYSPPSLVLLWWTYKDHNPFVSIFKGGGATEINR